jgi:hypothetical protein
MTVTIDKSNLTIFSAVTGGLTLAYALAVFMTRSNYQTGTNRGIRTSAHDGANHTKKSVNV